MTKYDRKARFTEKKHKHQLRDDLHTAAQDPSNPKHYEELELREERSISKEEKKRESFEGSKVALLEHEFSSSYVDD